MNFKELLLMEAIEYTDAKAVIDGIKKGKITHIKGISNKTFFFNNNEDPRYEENVVKILQGFMDGIEKSYVKPAVDMLLRKYNNAQLLTRHYSKIDPRPYNFFFKNKNKKATDDEKKKELYSKFESGNLSGDDFVKEAESLFKNKVEMGNLKSDKGVNFLWEGGGWKVWQPKTFEASKKYAFIKRPNTKRFGFTELDKQNGETEEEAHPKWCTTVSSKFFEQYQGEAEKGGKKLTYFINHDSSEAYAFTGSREAGEDDFNFTKIEWRDLNDDNPGQNSHKDTEGLEKVFSLGVPEEIMKEIFGKDAVNNYTKFLQTKDKKSKLIKGMKGMKKISDSFSAEKGDAKIRAVPFNSMEELKEISTDEWFSFSNQAKAFDILGKKDYNPKEIKGIYYHIQTGTGSIYIVKSKNQSINNEVQGFNSFRNYTGYELANIADQYLAKDKKKIQFKQAEKDKKVSTSVFQKSYQDSNFTWAENGFDKDEGIVRFKKPVTINLGKEKKEVSSLRITKRGNSFLVFISSVYLSMEEFKELNPEVGKELNKIPDLMELKKKRRGDLIKLKQEHKDGDMKEVISREVKNYKKVWASLSTKKAKKARK
jgi:hypothetical protein